MPVRHDYLTDRTSWLAAQDGRSGVELTPRDGSLRYMQTGRDLADYLWQLNSLVAWRNAAAIVGGCRTKLARASSTSTRSSR